jgi:polyferredoxin
MPIPSPAEPEPSHDATEAVTGSADHKPPEASAFRRVREILTSRWFVKSAFFAFFAFTCVELFRFESWAKGRGPFVHRPEAPAGLLPVGHFTSFFAWVRGGGWDTLLPAGLVIIIGALLVSWLFRRAFCGWICPVGTVWEAFAGLGRRIFGRNFRLPRWMDLTGRVVRFVLAGLVVGILLAVPLSEAVAFRTLPYMWTADIKILTIMISPVYLLVVLGVGIVSAFVGPVWCRYLCPVGGMYCAVSALSPSAIVRDEDTCIHCHRCTKVCHAFVAPENVRTVRDTECDGCMDCVKTCPVDGCLEARVAGRLRVAPWVWPLLAVSVWLSVYGIAKVTGNWDSRITPDQFRSAINSGVLQQSSMPNRQ